MPSRVALGGALCSLRTGTVAGFDLSPLNAFRWHPACAVIDAVREPKQWLSGPFSVADVDIAAFLSGAAEAAAAERGGAAGAAGQQPPPPPPLEGERLFAFAESLLPPAEATVSTLADGRCTCAVLWVDAELYPGGPTLTTVAPEHRPPTPGGAANSGRGATQQQQQAPTVHLESLKQAVWYFPEEVRLSRGQSVAVKARLVAGSRVLIELDPHPMQPLVSAAAAAPATSDDAAAGGSESDLPAPAEAPAAPDGGKQPPPRRPAGRARSSSPSSSASPSAPPPKPPRPRHSLIHQWHHDMLNDGERNAAYRTALERAVQRLRAAGIAEVRALRDRPALPSRQAILWHLFPDCLRRDFQWGKGCCAPWNSCQNSCTHVRRCPPWTRAPERESSG